MDSVVSLISVISAGIIAILSLFLPLFFGIISDSIKSRREYRISQITNIDETTVKILESLSIFRSGNVSEASRLANAEVYSNLLSRFYSWERAIWKELNKKDQELIKELRQKIENGNYHNLYEIAPSLAEDILSLVHKLKDKY